MFCLDEEKFDAACRKIWTELVGGEAVERGMVECFVKGRSVRAVARELGIPDQTFRRRLREGRALMIKFGVWQRRWDRKRKTTGRPTAAQPTI